MTIRAFVVDDEPLVRSSILRVLREDPEIEVLCECGDGLSAVKAIKSARPDLMFLDVHMPGLTGIQVIEELEGSAMPVTVFVTAHKDYAIEAFEANAVDYILKPFGRERLKRSIERAKTRLVTFQGSSYAAQLLQVLATVQRQQQFEDRIAVPINGRVLLIKAEEIDWIEADRNCVHLHSNRQVYELRTTLANIESRLDTKRFVRIHRSTLVNIARIKEIHPWFHGHHKVLLCDGTELRMSRYQNESVRTLLGQQDS